MSTVTKCTCGHEISQHTYSDSDTGCDIPKCDCTLDLGELIDKYAKEVADRTEQNIIDAKNLDILYKEFERSQDENKFMSEQIDKLNAPMPCGHLARYAVNGEGGTQYCCMCLATETQKENGVLRRYIATLENELDEQ